MSNSTAAIAVVDLIVAFMWTWARLGFGISVRRMSVRLEIGGEDAADEMLALAWLLTPFLPLLWFLTGGLIAREASGFTTTGPRIPVTLALAAMVSVAVRALCLGELPAWVYPGWMARRYYTSRPDARERELGARAVI